MGIPVLNIRFTVFHCIENPSSLESPSMKILIVLGSLLFAVILGCSTDEKSEEGLSKEEVLPQIEKVVSLMRPCYLPISGKVPSAIVNTKFTISPDGHVGVAEILTSTVEDKDFSSCIIGALKTMIFPPRKGAVEVKITYPFKFTTTSKKAGV